MTTIEKEPSAIQGLRIGVKARVLAAMGVAMAIFFVILLNVVYNHIAHVVSVSTARNIVGSLIPIITITLVVCGLLCFYLTNRFVLRPIRKIRDQTLAISSGQLDIVIGAMHNDEIGDLARSVDQMATTLKRDIQSLQEVDKLKSEFISLGSHTLRTPLASIEGGLDVLQSSQLNRDAKQMVDIIRSSANNLIAFSEDMLVIASVESKQGTTQQSTQSLGKLLEPVIAEIAAIAAKKDIQFETQLVAEDVPVRANQQLLRLAFRNILDNACKFTKPGGRVLLSADEVDNQIVVEVVDSGIGIASSELPNLFTKFHRGTDLLAYDYEGLGVGLYVAKLIFEQHDASISVSSKQGSGTTVRVSLPSAK